jgi:LacI family transcriptional regulator
MSHQRKGLMARISIADIARETGLSRATVDRAMHGREGVHPRTKLQVDQAIARLPATNRPPKRAVDVALRLDVGFMETMTAAARLRDERELGIHDLTQLDDDKVLAIVSALCDDITRPLVLTVKNTAPIVSELAQARRRGKRIVALISDLAPEARDTFVGIDNRAAGETAAFLVGRMLGDRATAVGFVLGDHAYRCHEDREVGFRSTLRSRFPKVVVAAEAIGRDNDPTTYTTVKELLANHPTIGAIYSVAGGHAGMVKAIEEAGRARDLMTIAHEANALNVPLLRAGHLDFLISQTPSDLLDAAIRHADAETGDNDPGRLSIELIDFNVHTVFNIPTYAR